MKYIDKFNGIWEYLIDRPGRGPLHWDLLAYNKNHIERLLPLASYGITEAYSDKKVQQFDPLNSIDTGEPFLFKPSKSFELEDNVFVEFDWLENNIDHVMTTGWNPGQIPGKVVNKDSTGNIIVAINFQISKDKLTKNDFI